MRRMPRIVLLIGLVALTPLLAACADFDMDKLDVFGLNEKKKLPGDRKDVFPQGVPGVSQGIPPEYIKGNQPQPQPETASSLPVEPEKSAPEAKAKKTAAAQPTDQAKPKPKAKRKPKPAQTAQPAAQEQQQPQQAQSPNQGLAPWPTSPAPGTFSR